MTVVADDVREGLLRKLSLEEAIRTLREIRRDDEIVITSMGSAREWMVQQQQPHPLDFILVPSSMGQATSFALGLALSRPDIRVIVCSGDGSLLMNLGSLVTITAEAPQNLIVIVLDNGVYEVTGAQPTPGASQARVGGREVDLLEMARAAGFNIVRRFTEFMAWRSEARQLFDAPGPVFIVLEILPVPGGIAPHAPRTGTAAERAGRFIASVASIPRQELYSIRRAMESDAADVSRLVGEYVASGSLLPRSESFVKENAADFVVAVEGPAGDRIVGCGHLEGYAPSLAELRSLAVHPDRHGRGIGRAIAEAIEDLARRRQYKTLFAVSNDESFFLRQGFEARDIPELDKERSAVSKFKGVFAKTLSN